ncbi:MAG: DivIVA domain-containing protein [Desulfopila sp.]
MLITPQSIKDQEFVVKFRGFDTVEVKAYLELLAEEFFELHEVRRRQEGEYAELYEEVQELKKERESLLEQSRSPEGSFADGEVQSLEQETVVGDLQKQVEALEQQVAAAELENNLQQEAWERQEAELRDEIEKLRGRLDDNQNVASESNGELEKLRGQIELLEKQITDSKQEEMDFKTALVAAQRFADDVKQKAKDEADQMLQQAIGEVESYRQESERELAKLPVQINELRNKKTAVREDLRAVLVSYLEQLDLVDAGGDRSGGEDEFLDLFQSIELEDEEVAQEGQVENFEDK